MKSHVQISEGKVFILLNAENEFERDMIEKIAQNRCKYEIDTKVLTDNSYYNHTNHRIELELKNIK